MSNRSRQSQGIMRYKRTRMWSLLLASVIAAGSPVRISGVHFEGLLKGNPEPDSAVRLINTDDKRPADVGGFTLTERFTPAPTHLDRHGDEDHPVRLPEGASIPPGGEIWIACTATGFAEVFGERPRYEAVATALDVEDASAPRGFLRLPKDHGTLALLDAQGDVVDFVAYEATAEPFFAEGALGASRKGEAVRVKKTSFYGWKGQVLARDRDEQGRILPDTDTAADWDSGFSRKLLGEEPTHRVEIAGQSRFVARPLRSVRAKVLATSAPDNNYGPLIEALGSAKKELRVRVYELTNPQIVDALVKAELRGVKVTVFLEGAPVGGIADQERWLVDRAHRAGVDVYFLAVPKGSRLKPRYRFDHSKYVLVDDRLAIVGSENYGRTGVPVLNSFGNRGWMIHVENPALVKQLRAVWDADFRPGEMADVLSIDASPTDAYGLPYRDPAFVPDEDVRRGLYEHPAAAVLVDEPMDLELVLSPDTSLNEHSALMGMMERAKKTLFLEQNSVRRRWGKRDTSSDPDSDAPDDADTAPNLPLQAVLKAARRGVQVRVLLDSTWYNVQGDEDRDNDDTVTWLNTLARKEGLDVSAKVVNLEATHLEKIHTKGVIADDAVFVGSINWTENSFKGNREVGVVVGDKKIAGYYEKLFLRDWSESVIYTADVIARADVHVAREGASKVLKHLGRGDRVAVVAEHGKLPDTDRAAWCEVQVAEGITGFVDPRALGVPEVTPGEALHVIGREAVIVGRVAATNVNEHRIQLRLADVERPPFTAVIFKSAEPKFTAKGVAPASAYQGHEVRIRGPVTTYKGPEVVLQDPGQIEIVR